MVQDFHTAAYAKTYLKLVLGIAEILVQVLGRETGHIDVFRFRYHLITQERLKEEIRAEGQQVQAQLHAQFQFHKARAGTESGHRVFYLCALGLINQGRLDGEEGAHIHFIGYAHVVERNRLESIAAESVPLHAGAGTGPATYYTDLCIGG